MVCTVDLLQCVDESKVVEFLQEATEAGEFVNPLWRLYETSFVDWLKATRKENRPNERLLAFTVNGDLVGVARVTERLNHIANGKVGFFIRPHRRKQKLAPMMIRMIEGWCSDEGINGLTATVDVKNTASLKALYSAGWERSGNQYSWNQGRTAIELKPKDSGS